MDIKGGWTDQETGGWMVAQLRAGLGGRNRKKKRKKEKGKRKQCVASCGLSWGLTTGGKGPGSHGGVQAARLGRGSRNHGPVLGLGHSPAERAWKTPLSGSRAAQVCCHISDSVDPLGVGPQPSCASSCHLSCSPNLHPVPMGDSGSPKLTTCSSATTVHWG